MPSPLTPPNPLVETLSARREIPDQPGCYRFYNRAGQIIYVGKASSLRRRLGQYARAYELWQKRKKRKPSRPGPRSRPRVPKIEKIVGTAFRLDWEVVPDVISAELREIELIQQHRPALNITAAYSRSYPYVVLEALDATAQGTLLRLTLEPREACARTPHPDYPATKREIYGAYRSRPLCTEAFEALERLLLLRFGGRRKAAPTSRYWRTLVIRGPECGMHWEDLGRFLSGHSPAWLERLTLELLEKPQARRDRAQVQEWLETAQKFYEEEAARLRRAIEACQYPSYPVSQQDRDLVFVRARRGSPWPSPSLLEPTP